MKLASDGKKIMPIFLVTGFFGSGKTTLLNSFLETKDPGMKVGILVNDFGDIGVDYEVLSVKGTGNIVLEDVTGGSIFCSCRHWEFVDGIIQLSRKDPEIIICEASGMADPTPLMEDLAIANNLEKDLAFRHGGTICLIDVLAFLDQVATFPVVTRQVKHATFIVLNKMDLAQARDGVGGIDAVKRTAREINPGAKILVATRGKVDFSEIFTVRNVPTSSTASQAGDRTLNEPGKQPLKLKLEGPGCLKSRQEVIEFHEKVKKYLLRMKGFLSINEKHFLVDATDQWISLTPFSSGNAKTGLEIILKDKTTGEEEEIRLAWKHLQEAIVN